MAMATLFLVALRESLEAILIVSIFFGLVVKLGQPQARKPLAYGALAALLVSILAGVLIDRTVRDVFAQSGSGEWLEGVASLVAVGILTYMVVWMYRHTLTLVDDFRKKTARALEAQRSGILFSLAFVAVAREGLETVLFFASAAPSAPASELVLSATLGIGASLVVGLLVFGGIVRLNIRRFFAATGLLLIFLAAGLLSTAIHEFSEIGIVPETATAWSTHGILPQSSFLGSLAKAVVGYRDSPTYLEAAAYLVYLLAMGAWYLRGVATLSRVKQSAPAEA